MSWTFGLIVFPINGDGFARMEPHSGFQFHLYPVACVCKGNGFAAEARCKAMCYTKSPRPATSA